MKVDHRKISVATSVESKRAEERPAAEAPVAAPARDTRRRLYFEDVEVRRSRTRGVLCRVTLKKGEESFLGEAEGMESERSRVDLAARATLVAITQAEGGERSLALDGCKVLSAFDREFVFVGVTAKVARESHLLTGSCEIKDSAETASALAVLDATNRWIAFPK
jgi:hypothetical protein